MTTENNNLFGNMEGDRMVGCLWVHMHAVEKGIGCPAVIRPLWHTARFADRKRGYNI
jgi:hypothetical protein